MKKLPHILDVLAVVLIILAVLYKMVGILSGGGFGVHDAGPLGIAPSGILEFAAILLLLSVAVNLQRLVVGKAAGKAAGAVRSAQAPEATPPVEAPESAPES